MNDTVGKRIREKRQLLKLSQEELAKKLGYTRTWVSNIERDNRSLPGIDVLMRICDVLQATPTYILTGYEDKDISVGKELGISGKVLNRLRGWQSASDYILKETGEDDFPINKQIDFILSVLVQSPLTVMMLYEYLTCPYDSAIISINKKGLCELPTTSVCAKDAMFTTGALSADVGFEPWARASLMDQLKSLRERLMKKEVLKDGKHRKEK